MITKDDLLAHGYRAYKQDNPVADNILYGKWFRDADQKLYYLHVTLWYFDRHYPARGAPKLSASCESRLCLPADNTLVGPAGIDLRLSLEPTATIEEMEAFYAHAYKVLGCVPDLHNQD